MSETKTNEKSAKTHTIYKINLESQKFIDGVNKIYTSIIYFIELSGSENISKANTDSLKKDNPNLNKSILSFSNILLKLSNNPKNIINYRDSKLMRILQPTFNGNFKISIICTISESNIIESHNTLNFGVKAKNIKLYFKHNENSESKVSNDNNKNKIKQSEEVKKDIINNDDINDKIKNQNEMITILEKEVGILKRAILNNEESTEHNLQDNYTINNKYQSASKFSDSARKIMRDDYLMKGPDSVFKRSMTDMKRVSMSNHKMSAFNVDYDMNEGNNDYLSLLKENDELRRNTYDLRRNYIETIQNKDNQIKSLNYKLNMTIEDCGNLMKEAEENFNSIKLNNERLKEELSLKEKEIIDFSYRYRNCLAEISLLKEELHKFKNERNSDLIYRELELKNSELNINNEKLIKENELIKKDLAGFKNSNDNYKNESHNINLQYENFKADNKSLLVQIDVLKKNNELLSNENFRMKNDIDSYKNEINSHKDKMNRIKSDMNQLKKLGSGDDVNYVKFLENQVNELKENIYKIEQTQIMEYQKLLDESFNKISELSIELKIANEKIIILENNIIEGLIYLY